MKCWFFDSAFRTLNSEFVFLLFSLRRWRGRIRPRIVQRFEAEAQQEMIYTVYVLKSLKNGKLYTGFTRKSVAIRISEHNDGKNRWTRNNRPFQLCFKKEFASRKGALHHETYLKSGAGRRYLRQFIPLFRPRRWRGTDPSSNRCTIRGGSSARIKLDL